MVQDARKASGLEVADRIALGLQTSGELSAAVDRHRDTIAAETLAIEIVDGALSDASHQEEATIDGELVVVTLARRERA